MNIIKLNCEQCGAPLEIDKDNLIAYCPHCGAKLMLDNKDMQEVLLSREQTKRDEMKYEHEIEMKNMQKEENKKSYKFALIFVAIFIVTFLLLVVYSTWQANMFWSS